MCVHRQFRSLPIQIPSVRQRWRAAAWPSRGTSSWDGLLVGWWEVDIVGEIGRVHIRRSLEIEFHIDSF